MIGGGPYRIDLTIPPDDSELWLRLDQALEMSLRDPDLAYWIAFDIWLDSSPKLVKGEFVGGFPEVAAAAGRLLACVAPPVDQRSLRMIGAAFRSRT
jgi:hypothetical protein